MNEELKNDVRNPEHYMDLTPYQAMKNIEKATMMKSGNGKNGRFYKLLYTIFSLCELAGFELQGRVRLKDKRTGKIYE